MKPRRFIAGLCIGLTLVISAPKPVRAEPITIWGIFKVIGVMLTAGSFWMTWQNSANAQVSTANAEVLNHLDATSEFPISGWCDSPAIRDKEVTQGWLVSVDDTESVRELIKGGFCTSGGSTFEGKYLVGIFSNEHQAHNFATVVRDRMNRSFDVYVATEPVDVSEFYP